MDIAHQPLMIARDAINLHITRGPFHEITPVHQDRGLCPLDLMIVVVFLHEHDVAVEIHQKNAPVRAAHEYHIGDRTGTPDFENTQTKCSMKVDEEMSIRGSTDDVVSELPEPGWFHYTSTRVLIRLNRHLLMIETALLGRDVLEILRSLDIIAEMLELG